MGKIERQDFVAVSPTGALLFNPKQNSFIVSACAQINARIFIVNEVNLCHAS